MTGLGAGALSQRLRRETRRTHPLLDATRLARALVAGQLGVRAWTEGLTRIAPVYDALEGAIARCAEGSQRGPGWALLACFHRPELHRSAPIRADLASLGLALDAPSPAARRYAARILEVERASPISLIGHAYVRFAADLGRSALAHRAVRAALALPAHATLHTLEHPRIADRGAYLAELAAYFDAIPRAHHDAIVSEARVAARLERGLVEELLTDLDGRAAPPRVQLDALRA